MPTTPWGLDPNSQHQTWCQWTFEARTYRAPWSRPPFPQVIEASRGFFGRLTRGGSANLEVKEQVPVGDPGMTRYLWVLTWDNRGGLDPDFREAVRVKVEGFVQAGFGLDATLRLADVVVLAGDAENGKPAAQLLVLPTRVEFGKLNGEAPA